MEREMLYYTYGMCTRSKACCMALLAPWPRHTFKVGHGFDGDSKRITHQRPFLS